MGDERWEMGVGRWGRARGGGGVISNQESVISGEWWVELGALGEGD